ncbi:hypothetical protein [Helicobacter felis]|nr:hypothetical protein [Helicobacter felis]
MYLESDLEYLCHCCEEANLSMKKYFGTLIGLMKFEWQGAVSYTNLSI